MVHAERRATQGPPAQEASGSPITVEVVWSDAPRHIQRCMVSLGAGGTVGEAVALAAESAGQLWSAVTDPSRSFSVWDRAVPRTEPLKDGDRIACLRGLQVDPMDARRRRHAVQKTAQAGAVTGRRQGKTKP